MATYTKKDLENVASNLENLLDLGSNIILGVSGAYGKARIEATTKNRYRHIENITDLGTKREVYEECLVAIRVLRMYKNRVALRKKYKAKKTK